MFRLRDSIICVIASIAIAAEARADLLITEVVDGPLTGGQPKWVELSNTGVSTVLLGGFSLGVKNNGSNDLFGGSAMPLTGTLAPGASIVVSFETDNGPGGSTFFSVYGQDPDIYSGDAINGNDTILVYIGAAIGDGSNTTLVDCFGEDGVDGAGTAWEYTDSYAHRCGDTANAGLFTVSDWSLPGANALEAGCSGNATCLTTNLLTLTNPWNHAGCAGSGPGNPYCAGDQGACPCSNDNDGSNGAAGCANGAGGGGAFLHANGSASVASANFSLHTTGLPPLQSSIYFQGNNSLNGGAGISFGNGLRCAGGAASRLEVVVSDVSGASSTTVDISVNGAVTPGDLRRYQHWYADPTTNGCGSGFNFSNGYEIVWSA